MMLFTFSAYCQTAQVKLLENVLLACLMGQYCFAFWRLSSSVICNTAGGRAGAFEVGWPTLHSGPVQLRPVRATPC